MVLPMKRERVVPSSWPLIARLEAAERRRRHMRRSVIAIALVLVACAALAVVLR